MILMLISPLIGLVSLQYFALNYSIQGLNRAILYTPIEIMYKGLITYGGKPLISMDDFEYIVLSYYNNIIPRYSKNYTVDFYYYNLTDQSMCLTNNCEGVEITINCKLNLTYDYHRVMFYELKENNHG